MKVKATMLGFYGNKRRYPGSIFEIDEKQFSKRWMDKNISPDAVSPAKPVKPSDKDKAVI